MLCVIDELVHRIDQTEEYPAEAVDSLLRDIHRDAPALPRHEVRALRVALERLEQAIRDQRERLDGRLGGLHRGRKAMRGYGYLKAARSGQRLRRKV